MAQDQEMATVSQLYQIMEEKMQDSNIFQIVAGAGMLGEVVRTLHIQ